MNLNIFGTLSALSSSKKLNYKLVCQQIAPSNGEIKNAACRCFLNVRHSLSIMWSREKAKILGIMNKKQKQKVNCLANKS